jgi:hypothetical protein
VGIVGGWEGSVRNTSDYISEPEEDEPQAGRLQVAAVHAHCRLHWTVQVSSDNTQLSCRPHHLHCMYPGHLKHCLVGHAIGLLPTNLGLQCISQTLLLDLLKCQGCFHLQSRLRQAGTYHFRTFGRTNLVGTSDCCLFGLKRRRYGIDMRADLQGQSMNNKPQASVK